MLQALLLRFIMLMFIIFVLSVSVFATRTETSTHNSSENSGGHDGLTLVEALLCACLIMVIIMVSVAPKLLCRWCHNKDVESHNEYEDEVVYGEVRHHDEPHCKHMHTTHCSNALYHKSNEGTNGNRYIISVALPKDNNIPTCERSVNQTPDIPPDNNEKITTTSESMQMIENPSQHLVKETNTNDKVINKREATHTPEVPPYCGSDMDDDEDDDDYVTMTQNPSYFHIEDSTVNHTELVPTACEGETNYTHTLDASLYDDDGTTMNRNPSYNLGKDFFTAANTLDSVKLLPNCKRETNLTPHISPYNDSDCTCVGVTQTPSCSLDRKFSAEPNKISAAANYHIEDATVNHTELVPTVCEGETNYTHTLDASMYDDDGTTMTRNPSYNLGRDFFTAANTLDTVKLLPTCKRETNLTPHISPYNDSGCVGVTQMPSCSLDRKFSAEPNKISAAADYIAPISSHDSKYSHNAIKMTDINTNGIIMTNNPSYQPEKDFYDEQ